MSKKIEHWRETIANSDTYCSKCNYHIKSGQIILIHFKYGKLEGISCQGCHVGWNLKVEVSDDSN